jgi:predicted PurR-regulated permease PerM
MSSTPKWSNGTKWFVLIICTILLGLAVWQFSIALAPLVVAVIIAYLLNPPVNWLTDHTPLKRPLAAFLVYTVFLFVLALFPTLGIPLIVQQIQEVDFDLYDVVNQLDTAMGYQVVIQGIPVSLKTVSEPIVGSLNQIFSPAATWVAGLAYGIAGGFMWAIFIFMVGFYFLLDANRFRDWVDSWVPPDYLPEFKLLRQEIDHVWKAYFIGQMTLAMIMGFFIGGTMTLLGVKSALLLGVIAALAELIPLGYTISGAIGTIFALLQGSTYIPLPPWAFALGVAIFYFVTAQIDTNYLIPRIIGYRLKLPAGVIIVGVIAGAAIAGGLGLLLAAPTIATVRVLGNYFYRRLLDLEPYIETTPPPLIAELLEEDLSLPPPRLAEQLDSPAE